MSDYCETCGAPATIESESVESSPSSGYLDAWRVIILTCGHEISYRLSR